MLRKRPFVAVLALVVVGLIFGVSLVMGFGNWKGMNLAFGADEPTLGGALPNLPNNATLEDLNGSYVAIAKAVQPTIVQINVKTAPEPTASNGDENPFRHFFGGDGGGFQFNFPKSKPAPEEGIGSGVIITSDGYILTNNHVVKDAAKKGGITVKMTDHRMFDARVIGTDPTTDIAVIKIDATNLPVAALGNSDNLSVGQIVFAVGNPLGLESTVTQGIVSSLHRPLNIFDTKEVGNYGIANFIQTDAAINPGNSGGGLFNVEGQVVGINSAIASGTGYFAGYGFAVPINMAKSVAMDLIKSGKVNRGYIGVEITGVDQTTAQALGLDRPEGVLIQNVQPGGAGEAAGLKQKDVILSVDGHSTDEANELQAIIGMHHAGDHVTLKVWRDGKDIEKTVTLKPREDIADNASNDNGGNDQGMSQDESDKTTATLNNIGISVRNVTSDDKDKYGVSNGVVITDVQEASEAYDRYLQTNMVITKAANQKVTSAGEFQKIVDENKGKAIGLNVVDSNQNSRFFAVRVPSE